MKTAWKRDISHPAMRIVFAAMVAIWAWSMPVMAGGAGEGEGAGGDVTAISQLSTQAWTLAEQGKLPEVWQMIERLPAADDADPMVASLKKDLAEHEKSQADRNALTRTAHDKAVGEMVAATAKGDLTKALSHAVAAHGLAADRKAFLQDPRIVALTEQAKTAAEKAEAAGDWFGAMSLYRRLELLYDDHTYDPALKRTGRTLRMLKLYVPADYYKLADDYAVSQGDKPLQHWAGEEDTWDKQLAGIDMNMARQALTMAADKHVESPSYDQLFKGGYDTLRVMVNTGELKGAFAGLGDAEKVKAFDDYLQRQQAALNRRTTPMTYTEANDKLRELVEQNQKTVNIAEPALLHEFDDGVIDTLDPFSQVIWPDEKKRFDRMTRQTFSGVGIQITLTDEELTCVTPIEDSPGQRAGIKPGDRIVTIDGKSTTGITLDQAVEAITGPEGTVVTLGIRSVTSDKVRDVPLVRKTIKIQSVKGFDRRVGGLWNYWVDPAQRIGYIRITQFGPDTADEMDAAYNAMRYSAAVDAMSSIALHPALVTRIANAGSLSVKPISESDRDEYALIRSRQYKNLSDLTDADRAKIQASLDKPEAVRGLVLDLRFNPGGLLKAAVDVCDRFISEGAIVTGGSSSNRPFMADDKDTYAPAFPMIILINPGSASASEITAGCLQEHHRALILGENSYGKGSVQQLYPIPTFNPQAYAKITMQYYKLPSGRIIHRRPGVKLWGIQPDVEVRMTEIQVAKLIKARMLIDVLKDSTDPDIKPEDLLGHVKNKDENKNTLDELDDGRPVPTTAVGVLKEGYDPQLETASLLLKTRLLSDNIALTKAEPQK
ncbi:MAG: S41 family peptidase [Phycisphaeraceae bacterium]